MKRHIRRVLENLYGPTGSVIVHVFVVLALVKFVAFKGPRAETQVEAIIKQPEEAPELDDIEQELDKLDDLPTLVETVAPPTVSLDREPPPVDSLASSAESADLTEFDVMEAVSPLKFKGLYASRSSSGRADALRKYSGGFGEQTEYAVRKALEWLKTHQYPDGSWGPYYRVSMTALGLLTFLAHGETTASDDYGPTVRRALRYLLKSQQNGMFVGGGPVYHSHMHRDQIAVYEHGIGTYAMSEAYGLTGIPFLKISMEDAVQIIIDGQNESGSWDYGYRRGPDANIDVSVSGWHIQALKAAAIAGAENRGLMTAIDSSIRGLKAMVDEGKSGMFAYGTRLERAPDKTMTGVAVLCMQLVGHALDAEARAGVDALKDLQFRWSKGLANQDIRQVGTWPFYAWYYITQARFHQGGRTWLGWNRQFAPLLCSMQNSDGSWCPAPDSEEGSYGPVYCTTLGALMLQVYYRFLPTYQAIEVEGTTPVEEDTDEEEIVIKFG